LGWALRILGVQSRELGVSLAGRPGLDPGTLGLKVRSVHLRC
jgi:hypothetical protein